MSNAYLLPKVDRIGQAVKGVSAHVQFLVMEGQGFRQARYEKDGQLDYETYRRVQNEGNRLKLSWTYARADVIARISRHAKRHIPDVTGILCHGVRNGSELKWFAEGFPEAETLGTDIADSAASFPNTIQWDFHDSREDWKSRWSIVYTNSWDHAMDPVKAFRAWADSLKPGGILYLEHGPGHDQSGTDTLDLFGADRKVLSRMVADATGLVPLRTVKRMFSVRAVLPFQKKI
jgi:SAM-dependent methyltransferase